MTIVGTVQRSEHWYAARRGMPTCSRFSSILTAARGGPSKAQDTLINELLAESLTPPEQGVIRPPTSEMEHGIILEAEARCCYELEYSKEPVREAGFIVHDSRLFGGSPDALVGETGGVEIKCPNAATHIGYLRDGGLPNEYKCQVHGYLIVTGRAWWDFFSYGRNLPRFILHVERDEFTDRLAAELLAFCKRYNAIRLTFGLPPIGVTP